MIDFRYSRVITSHPGQNFGIIEYYNSHDKKYHHVCDCLEPFPSIIPDGTYRLILHKWSKSGQLVPMFLNIPGHSYVLIHTGNYLSDSRGCLLVGTLVNRNTQLENSRIALGTLMAHYRSMQPNDIFIQVVSNLM